MVSIALPNSEQTEREVHGHFTQRVIAQSRNPEQNVSWVQRTGRGETQIRKSTMQLDPEGLSWVDTLNAEKQEKASNLNKEIRQDANKDHRQKVGAEKGNASTPTLKPLFSSNPAKGKFSLARLKEAAQPKSLAAALFN